MAPRGEWKDLSPGSMIVAPANFSRPLFSSGVPLFGAACLLTALTVWAPLATYTVTLAVFGLPHVLSELRYVDRRFGRRLDRRFLLPILLLLPMIVAVRASWVLHLIPTGPGLCGELFGVALLALLCARGSGARKSVAVAVAVVLGGATAVDSFATAVALSILPQHDAARFSLADRAPRATIQNHVSVRRHISRSALAHGNRLAAHGDGAARRSDRRGRSAACGAARRQSVCLCAGILADDVPRRRPLLCLRRGADRALWRGHHYSSAAQPQARRKGARPVSLAQRCRLRDSDRGWGGVGSCRLFYRFRRSARALRHCCRVSRMA